MKKLFLALLILVFVGFACWLILPKRQSAPLSAWTKLPNGSQIRIVGLTYGTNHSFGSFPNMPGLLQAVMYRLLGRRFEPGQKITTTTPQLVVWIEHNTSSLTLPSPCYRVFPEDSNHFISGEGSMLWPMPGMPKYISIPLPVFPRRSREIKLNIFQDFQTNGSCCSLSFTNPQFRDYPTWQPESLPATKRVGDLEVTLVGVETGYDYSPTLRARPAGRGREFVYGTNRLDGQNWTWLDLNIKSLSNTNEIWRVGGVVVSDATGNSAKNSGTSTGGKIFTFAPSLWPSETAWKLKLELTRTEPGLQAQTNRFVEFTVKPELPKTVGYLK